MKTLVGRKNSMTYSLILSFKQTNMLDFKKLSKTDEWECKSYFKEYRERHGIQCKKCNSSEHYWLSSKWQWQCNKCRFRTTLRSGTLMQNSNLPLHIWFKAVQILVENHGAISANQLRKLLNKKSYETAWRLFHKLRKLAEHKNHLRSIKPNITERKNLLQEIQINQNIDIKLEERKLNKSKSERNIFISNKSRHNLKIKVIIEGVFSSQIWRTIDELLRTHQKISFKYLKNYIIYNNDSSLNNVTVPLEELVHQFYRTRSSGIIPDNPKIKRIFVKI